MIQARISRACAASGRDNAAVRLVAVSKTRPPADIAEAATAGQRIFGENYVQELLPKARELEGKVEWHFIGHLQSNKVRQIAGLVSMIHSVDRLSLAEEISRQWLRTEKNCDILVQFNISGEQSKSGASADDALKLVRSIACLPAIKVKGLMTMPPFFDDPEEARPYFRRLRELSDIVKRESISGVEMQELSMGMSGDFEVAIEEGATLVRVGTAIFGER